MTIFTPINYTKPRYHFSTDTGKVEKCTATRRICKFGDNNHSNNPQDLEAKQALFYEAEATRIEELRKIIESGDRNEIRKHASEIWKLKFEEESKGYSNVRVYGPDFTLLTTGGETYNTKWWQYYHKDLLPTDIKMEPIQDRYQAYVVLNDVGGIAFDDKTVLGYFDTPTKAKRAITKAEKENSRAVGGKGTRGNGWTRQKFIPNAEKLYMAERKLTDITKEGTYQLDGFWINW